MLYKLYFTEETGAQRKIITPYLTDKVMYIIAGSVRGSSEETSTHFVFDFKVSGRPWRTSSFRGKSRKYSDFGR